LPRVGLNNCVYVRVHKYRAHALCTVVMYVQLPCTMQPHLTSFCSLIQFNSTIAKPKCPRGLGCALLPPNLAGRLRQTIGMNRKHAGVFLQNAMAGSSMPLKSWTRAQPIGVTLSESGPVSRSPRGQPWAPFMQSGLPRCIRRRHVRTMPRLA
jgi:hypothetical protein